MNQILLKMLLVMTLFFISEKRTSVAEQPEAEFVRVYVGTYTRKASKGIYTFTLNLESGETSQPQLAAETVNPSFVAISPNRQFLYAVNEVSNFAGDNVTTAGGVTAFQINSKSGMLTKLNSQLSGGTAPCHLTVDQTGRCLIVANYGTGSVASFPIEKDGALQPAASLIQHEGSSINPRRQTGPHAHSVNLDASNTFAIVADLGVDKLFVYRLDREQATLAANDPPYVETIPGGGPRHLSFHPLGKYAYANNELLLSVTAYKYDSRRGLLTPMQTASTVPEGTPLKGNSTAETLVHPSGKFLYVSNRGPNSIAIFQILDDGTLELMGIESTQGEIPRGFGIDPTGRYLIVANQNSDSIVVFEIDQTTGLLKPTGTVLEVPTPVNVRMLPLSD